MMEAAKVCFHDVQLFDQRDPVHPLINELQNMPAEIKAKTILYHYGDEWDTGPFDFVEGEFKGFAESQQRYVLFD